jgi:hypothetical protein
MSQIGNVYAGEDPAIDPSVETLYTFQAPLVTLFDPPHTPRGNSRHLNRQILKHTMADQLKKVCRSTTDVGNGHSEMPALLRATKLAGTGAVVNPVSVSSSICSGDANVETNAGTPQPAPSLKSKKVARKSLPTKASTINRHHPPCRQLLTSTHDSRQYHRKERHTRRPGRSHRAIRGKLEAY